MPTFQQKMVVQMKEQQETLKKSRETKLAELKTKEAAAKAKEAAAKTKEETEKAKEETTAIVEERETFENSPDPDLSAVTDMMGWNIMSDAPAGCLLLHGSRFGDGAQRGDAHQRYRAVSLAEWGRRMAVTVAWLKILRWVAMTIVTMVLIVPITAEKPTKCFARSRCKPARNRVHRRRRCRWSVSGR